MKDISIPRIIYQDIIFLYFVMSEIFPEVKNSLLGIILFAVALLWNASCTSRNSQRFYWNVLYILVDIGIIVYFIVA